MSGKGGNPLMLQMTFLGGMLLKSSLVSAFRRLSAYRMLRYKGRESVYMGLMEHVAGPLRHLGAASISIAGWNARRRMRISPLQCLRPPLENHGQAEEQRSPDN